jgi:oligosaccharide repeat unit polymerase
MVVALNTAGEVAASTSRGVSLVQRRSARSSPGSVRVWWHSPIFITAIIIPASVSATALVGQWTFVNEWRSLKLVTAAMLLTFLCAGLMLSVGAALASGTATEAASGGLWARFSQEQLRLLRIASSLFFWLTVAGYVAFTIAIYKAGVSVSVLSSYFTNAESGAIRDAVGTVVGVTTMTQFGVAAVIVSVLLLFEEFTRKELLKLAVVIGLAIPRSVFFTERLAILELVVPVVVLVTARFAQSGRGHRIVSALPIVMVPSLLALFAVFEYARSWTFYSRVYSDGFVRFVLERFGGYYATAYNNGFILMTYADPPGRWPYKTLGFFWSAPLIKGSDLALLANGYDPAALFQDAVEQHGNWEFNNPSGIASALVDYGIIGGALYLLVAGACAGFLYRRFCASQPVGVLLYPVVYIGLLEMPRYIYWSEGRATPALISLAVLAGMLSRRRSLPAAREGGLVRVPSRKAPEAVRAALSRASWKG